MLRSLEQKRAKYAWECVQEVTKKGDEEQKKYSSYVRRATTLIQVNGLPNVLAFYYSKLKDGEEGYKLLYNHINNWDQLKKLKGDKDILNWIINDASFIEVFKATKESIALLSWMKRFAEAELSKKSDKDSQ